jgi:hypothetical protein
VEHDIVRSVIAQLRSSARPTEQVLAQWDVVPGRPSVPQDSPAHKAAYTAAVDLIDALRGILGPTGDPSWVDDVVSGRAPDEQPGDDYVFALFRTLPDYVYVRLRADRSAASHLRLIAGVVRIPKDHLGDE